jgi:hypothetical protein
VAIEIKMTDGGHFTTDTWQSAQADVARHLRSVGWTSFWPEDVTIDEDGDGVEHVVVSGQRVGEVVR